MESNKTTIPASSALTLPTRVGPATAASVQVNTAPNAGHQNSAGSSVQPRTGATQSQRAPSQQSVMPLVLVPPAPSAGRVEQYQQSVAEGERAQSTLSEPDAIKAQYRMKSFAQLRGGLQSPIFTEKRVYPGVSREPLSMAELYSMMKFGHGTALRECAKTFTPMIEEMGREVGCPISENPQKWCITTAGSVGTPGASSLLAQEVANAFGIHTCRLKKPIRQPLILVASKTPRREWITLAINFISRMARRLR